MPRFAANLAYLFTERPLLERFGAAAAAGFTERTLANMPELLTRFAIDGAGITAVSTSMPKPMCAPTCSSACCPTGA